MNMIATGFYILTLVMLASPLLIRVSADGLLSNRIRVSYITFVMIWLSYVFVMSESRLLEDFTLPPRVPIFFVIPMVVGILFITSRNWFKHSLLTTSVSSIVYVQAFRILVELLIYGASEQNIFPKRATFEGLNYDIVVGISALIIGFLVQRNLIGKTALLVWNFFSLTILAVTVYSFISTYYFTDYPYAVGNFQFVKMPYVLLASVLLPVAIFFHVASIRQIRMLVAMDQPINEFQSSGTVNR
jgi:hypothetical protein